MTFFNPLAWWSLILMPLLLLLYLPRRPQDVRWVANLYLWQQSLAQSPFHLSVARFHSNWLVLLHLLFLLTGILALTRPALTWPTPQSRSHVFLFDVSASMQTVEHGQSRFAKAREAAVARLDSLRAGDRVMIMQAHVRPVLSAIF